MPTREQLEGALRNADAAGDSAAAKKLANALKAAQYDQSPSQPVASNPVDAIKTQSQRRQTRPGYGEGRGIVDRFTGDSMATPEIRALEEIGAAPELNALSVPAFKASLGLLTTGDTESLKGILNQQFGDSVSFTEDEKGNPIVNFPSGSYALNQPGLSGQDVVRSVFDVLSFTPAGRASTVPRAAGAAGATQAAIETAESATGGGFDPEDVALAAGLGAGGKVLENVVSTGYRAATGRPAGETAEVARFAEAEDLPLMTTDVVQPSTFAGRSAQALGEKIPVAGTGAQRAAQQEAREDIVQRTARRFGDYSPSDIVDSLKKQTSKVKRAAGDRLGNISRRVAEDSSADKAIKAIDSEIERLSTLPGGVARQTADSQTIKTLQAYRDDLVANPTFEALQDLRTSFRENVKGDRLTMPSQSDAAINKIYSAMSDDLFDTVESSLGRREAMRWKAANRAYANEASVIKNTAIKKAMDKGDITPEVVNSMLYSQKASDVENLFRSLDDRGKQAARAGIIGRAVEPSMGSPDRFVNEMKKLQKHVGTVFKGQDKAFVNGLTKYLDSTREAAKAATTTKSGQELFQIGAPVGVMADIGATGGAGTAGAATFGLMARAYESAPIRKLMMRLNAVPKGSTGFEKTLTEIQSALTASAQAVQE